MTLLSAFASVLLSLPTANAVAPGSQVAEFPEVQVPFGCGLVFPVSQGHDVGSHTYNDVYAWDFRMPEGVPIVAASDGVVRMARGDSTVGGCDPSYAPYANYVVVNHGNGYETQYLHFRDVIVKVGDVVKAGDLLGFSGKTGWACGSHLHFKVARPDGAGWNNPSVPARINGYGDPTINTVIAAPACRPPEIQMAKNGMNAELKSAEPASVPPSPGTSVVQSATGASPGVVMPAASKQAEPAKASSKASTSGATQSSQVMSQQKSVTSI